MNARERRDARAEQTQARQAGSLDQVRELLFGAIYRELERKLVRADAQLATKAEELQHEAKRRTEVLEGHLTRQIEALTARLEKEHVAQVEALGRTSREHREAVSLLEQRIGKLEDALGRAQRDMRQELLAQSKEFLDELHHARAEVAAMVDREIALLRDEEQRESLEPSEPAEPTAPPAH